MNAALRAVIRTALTMQIEIVGISHGYKGLITGQYRPLGSTSVSNIVQRGGTILKSARSEQFRTASGRVLAYQSMEAAGIEGLIVIGGDGSFTGANLFSKEHGVPVVGVPATIDNDLMGTDYTIGYDTALNTATEAIDKIRDTADAHERLFLVEVMGRNSGFIALETGIASGAELILLPEQVTEVEEARANLKGILKEHRRSSLVVVAEGDETGGALKLAEQLQDDFREYEMRVCILGHIQRGGAPSARDRVLASRLGAEAVKQLQEGNSRVMVGIVNGQMKVTPIEEAISGRKPIDFDLIELYKILR